MPYTETGAERIKRKAYEKGNKERGIAVEKQKDYERFGTTEQNIPVVNPMGDVAMPMSANMKKGGKVMQNKHNVDHVKQTFDSAGHKHEQDKVKPHAAGFKAHHEHVKAMCMGGKVKK
jgi:hypothetical protein